jgi:hypothetical protein
MGKRVTYFKKLVESWILVSEEIFVKIAYDEFFVVIFM